MYQQRSKKVCPLFGGETVSNTNSEFYTFLIVIVLSAGLCIQFDKNH